MTNIPRNRSRVIPLTRDHIRECKGIVAVSEPWKSLGEGVNFTKLLKPEETFYKAYVCIRGNDTLGFIVFCPVPVFARGGYIRAIGVSSVARRLGIGSSLMSFAERVIGTNAPNVYVCVTSFNRQAQRFYQGLGYHRVGKLPGLINDHSTEYIYWKQLRAVHDVKSRKGIIRP